MKTVKNLLPKKEGLFCCLCFSSDKVKKYKLVNLDNIILCKECKKTESSSFNFFKKKKG